LQGESIMDMKRAVPAFAAILLAGASFLAAAQAAPARTIKVKVTAEQANLREMPDIGSGILQQIPEGTVLEADRKEGEWFFVRYTLEDGGVIGGWIHESLVEVVPEARPVPAPVKKPVQAATPAAPPVDERPRTAGPVGRPLELSVSAGLGLLSPRDLNDGTRGFADWFGASIGIPAPGDADILHLGLLASVELAYRISPRLAFGIAADHLRAASGSEMVFTDELLTETLSTKPSVRGVPVKLTVRFYPGAGLYFRGALGVYSVKAGYLYRREGADSWEQWRGSASASGFGGEAAFGGEWAVAPSTVLFAEAGFRMADFGGLAGEGVYTNSAGDRLTESGRLYYVRRTGADDRVYPVVIVSASEPAGPDVVSVRLAGVNISGLSLQAGLRFKF
jgi:hypothetical protein